MYIVILYSYVDPGMQLIIKPGTREPYMPNIDPGKVLHWLTLSLQEEKTNMWNACFCCSFKALQLFPLH